MYNKSCKYEGIPEFKWHVAVKGLENKEKTLHNGYVMSKLKKQQFHSK